MIYHNPIFEKINTEKKERILQAAIIEFSSKGFNLANINHIAANAEVSVGSLYKYFDNKRNMYLYVIHENVEKIRTVLEKILSETHDIETTIRRIIQAIQVLSRRDEYATKLYNIMTTEHNSELVWQISSQMEGATATLYADLIEKAKENGEITKDIDSKYSAFFMDNLFVMLQFSYACEYYKQRLEMFVGKDVFENDEKLENAMVEFISNALRLG